MDCYLRVEQGAAGQWEGERGLGAPHRVPVVQWGHHATAVKLEISFIFGYFCFSGLTPPCTLF